MNVIWLRRADATLTRSILRIAEEDEAAARNQLDEITRQAARLARHPHLGRAGRLPGTRELSIARTPFIVVYRILPRVQRIEILLLLHNRQQWPSR